MLALRKLEDLNGSRSSRHTLPRCNNKYLLNPHRSLGSPIHDPLTEGCGGPTMIVPGALRGWTHSSLNSCSTHTGKVSCTHKTITSRRDSLSSEMASPAKTQGANSNTRLMETEASVPLLYSAFHSSRASLRGLITVCRPQNSLPGTSLQTGTKSGGDYLTYQRQTGH